jgi:L-alanine-DL-glutamate epimerase-like enolase superfamily enzyme
VKTCQVSTFDAPNTPGLGVTINEEALKEFTLVVVKG